LTQHRQRAHNEQHEHHNSKPQYPRRVISGLIPNPRPSWMCPQMSRRGRSRRTARRRCAHPSPASVYPKGGPCVTSTSMSLSVSGSVEVQISRSLAGTGTPTFRAPAYVGTRRRAARGRGRSRRQACLGGTSRRAIPAPRVIHQGQSEGEMPSMTGPSPSRGYPQ
jgi:hypothetical protein